MGRTRREYQGNRELAEGINDSEIDQNINAINEQTIINRTIIKYEMT
jgi:hypothetical protein